MKTEQLQCESWTVRRWIGLAIIIFAAQIGVLLRLGKNGSTIKSPVQPAPVLITADRVTETAVLENPTLFALPNQHGFSGHAWLTVPFAKHKSAEWVEPQYWLNLRADELGAAFQQLLRSNSPRTQIAQKIEPEYVLLRLPSPDVEFNPHSDFRIEGPLANRAMLSRFKLEPQAAAGLLTNSVVQLIVNAAGFTRTATLLASSGSSKADEQALVLSQAARFEPLPLSQAKKNPRELTSGQFVFEWQTVPFPATNAAINP